MRKAIPLTLPTDNDMESVKNNENDGSKSVDDTDSADTGRDRSSGSLYDYNTEQEIRQQLKNQKNDVNQHQSDVNLRHIQNSFDDLMVNKNTNDNQQNSDNKNKFNDNNNEDDFFDLQRSRSVVSPQERNIGQQLIGRSVSGVRVTVTSSTSEPIRDVSAQQRTSKQNEPPKNNRVPDDLQNPNFDEAIAAIVDQNGGIHLNDGPGSLFSLVASDDGDEDEVSVFVKPINTEVKQNIRRGLPNSNQIVVLNRTQLALIEPNSRANSRYQPSQQQIQRQPQQPHYVTIQHQITNPYTQRENRTLKASDWPQPPSVPLPAPPASPQQSQRTQSRGPRQRIHIVVNNRTQVKEIPIDDPIDFQRIPAIHQTAVNRYSTANNRNDHRRPIATTAAPTTRATTPVPRREATERPILRQNPSERRQIGSNVRTVSPIPQPNYDIQPEVVSVRRETIPQRPPPIYRTPEPYSTAVACNQKACRLPDCFCAGSDIPGI